MLNNFFDKFIFTGGIKYRHNNFYLLNIPFLIAPLEILASIAGEENEALNKKIYSCVKGGVRKNLISQFDLDFGLQGDKEITLMEEFFTACGWGAIRKIDLDKKNCRAIIVVENSPIASALHGKVKREADHFLRGIFAGIFSHFFEKNVDCVEHKCLALNENECEFVIQPQKEFDFTKKQALEQLEL